jgi:hypothetical protein
MPASGKEIGNGFQARLGLDMKLKALALASTQETTGPEAFDGGVDQSTPTTGVHSSPPPLPHVGPLQEPNDSTLQVPPQQGFGDSTSSDSEFDDLAAEVERLERNLQT